MKSRRSGKLLDGRLVLLLLSAALAAEAKKPGSWHVQIRGSDVTTSAAPAERDGALVVNVSALASALNVNVQTQGNEVVLRDASGAEWRGRAGQRALDGLGQHRLLASPILVEGSALYLPLDAAAELAGLELSLDEAAKVASLAPAASAAGGSPDAWESFSLAKNPEQLARDARIADGNRRILTGSGAVARLPVAHDSLRLSTDLGYVQGADWGSSISASGKIAGVQTDLYAMMTLGERGLDSVNRRLSALDPVTGWGAEAGDLYTEIRSQASGLRASWKAGDKRWPTVSLYFKDADAGNSKTVLSYRDEIAFTSELGLGGELATDGSLILKARFHRDRLHLNGFYLRSPRSSLGGEGLNAGYSFRNGISLQGNLSRSGSGPDRSDSRIVSLFIPVRRALDLTLEHTHTATASTRSNFEAAGLRLPLGPARLYFRYQLQDTTITVPTGDTTVESSSRQHSLLSSISYSPAQRLSLSLDGSSLWTKSGSSEPRAQLVAAYQLSPRTRLQVAGAFPDISDPEQLRLRLDVGLPRDLALLAEYGRLSPFQDSSSTEPEQELFKLTLRKRWSIATRGSGGQLSGTVRDNLGQPLPGAGVQLGNFTAVADPEGRYTFKNVPAGAYEAQLSRQGLPANYGTQEAAKPLEITRGSREAVDFTVAQLDVIRGWVYCDKDHDGRRGPGEGVGRIPLQLEGRSTATESDGAFAFYNLAPGPYSVQLVARLLPQTYALDSSAEAAVKLEAGQPATGLEFRLVPKEREIVFQDFEGETEQPDQDLVSSNQPEPSPVRAVQALSAASMEPPVQSRSMSEPGSPQVQRDLSLRSPSHGALKEAMDQLSRGRSVEIRFEAGFYHVKADGEPTGAFRLLSDVPMPGGALGDAAAQFSRGALAVRIERHGSDANPTYLVRREQS